MEKIFLSFSTRYKHIRSKGLLQIAEQILFVFLFCLILLFFILLNYKTAKKSIEEQWKKEGNIQQKLLQVEKDFQGSVYRRRDFINLYGLALKTMNWRIVGNFDFVKDTQNVMQMFWEKRDTSLFLKNMKDLKEVTEKAQTPLIYISLPDKEKYLEFSQSDMFCIEYNMSNQVGKLLKGTVDCIDTEALLSVDETAPSFDEFYFRTDGHCSTKSEFWMAKTLVNHLQNCYGIDFFNAQQVFDLEQYNITNHEFLGNEGRSVGEFFAGIDNFEIYMPKFETDLELINPSMSERKSGSFDKVMLNGYENKEDSNKYTYWVTNYGRFTSPYYKYINKCPNNDSPKILLISDSVFWRGASYLTLACKELTILDPRYFNGNEYVAQLLSLEHYDAVVVVAISSLNYIAKFSAHLEMPEMPVKNMISQEEYGKWIGNQGTRIVSCNGRYVGGQTDITLDSKEMKVTLCGWAADFYADKPLQELYLQIGNVTKKCEYGIEQSNVVDYFGKDSLLKTGFKVEFPVTYLKDDPNAKIAFIGVSADGKYLYEPIKYYLLRKEA